MAPATRDLLSQQLRGHGIDNFGFEDDLVRVGRALWRVVPCGCADRNCDGWTLERSENART